MYYNILYNIIHNIIHIIVFEYLMYVQTCVDEPVLKLENIECWRSLFYRSVSIFSQKEHHMKNCKIDRIDPDEIILHFLKL